MSFALFEPLRGSPQHRASRVPTYPEVKAVPDDADVEQVHGVAGKHEVKKPMSRPVLHHRVLVYGCYAESFSHGNYCQEIYANERVVQSEIS